MDVPVQIVFLGLVAFLPTSQPAGYVALLPDTTGGQYTSDGCHLGEHLAMMIVDAETCTMSSANTPCKRVGDDQVPPELRKNVLNSLFFVSLEHQDLTINLTPAPQPQTHARKSYGMTPRNPEEALDLHWLSSVPGKNKVNPDCTAAAKKTCRLNARVTLQNAVPRTCHLVTHNDEICSYRLRSPYEWWPFDDPVQALADGTIVTYTAPGGSPVRMSIGDLWSSQPSTLTLTPTGTGIRIWIADLDLTAKENKTDACIALSHGRHFEIFYDLLAADPQSGLPLPIDQRPSPAEEAECKKASEIQVAPRLQCPEAPPQDHQSHHMSDLSACGHAGQMMLSQ